MATYGTTDHDTDKAADQANTNTSAQARAPPPQLLQREPSNQTSKAKMALKQSKGLLRQEEPQLNESTRRTSMVQRSNPS